MTVSKTRKSTIAATAEGIGAKEKLQAFAANLKDGAYVQFDEESYSEFVLPSWKRALVAATCNIAVVALGAASAYVLGLALATFAAAATGSVFIALCVYYFVVIAGCFASISAGSFVAEYIVQGKFNRDMGRASTWLRLKLARGEATVH